MKADHATRDARHWRHTNHPLRRAWLRWRSPQPVACNVVTLPAWIRFDTPRDRLAQSILAEKVAAARLSLVIRHDLDDAMRYIDDNIDNFPGISWLLKRQAD